MKIYLRTLTPIHIGTGIKLTGQDFLDNHRISYDKFFSFLGDKYFEELSKYLTENENVQSNIIDYIKKFKLNKNEVKEKFSLYNFNYFFGNEVNEGIKDNENKFFIPGSSIKGVVRTALMLKVLKSNNSFDKLIGKIKSSLPEKPKDRDLKESDKKLEEEVFMCGIKKQDKNVIYSDQKYDLLKIIKISDSSSIEVNESGEISILQVYALKKSEPHKSFKIQTESIISNVTVTFNIEIDLPFLLKVRELLNDPDSNFGKYDWIDFEKKFQSLFGFDIKNKNEEITEEKIVIQIIKSLNQFGNFVSNKEKEWIDSLPEKEQKKNSALNKLYKTENKFKIGFGTGFSGMTMLTILLENAERKKVTESIFKKYRLGYHRKSKTDLSIDSYPFTRKFTNDSNFLGGFGWCQIATSEIEFKQETSDGSNDAKPNVREANPKWIKVEITDNTSKPPKVKILDGDYKGKEVILPGVNLQNLDINLGDTVYAELSITKKGIIEKAIYKGKL